MTRASIISTAYAWLLASAALAQETVWTRTGVILQSQLGGRVSIVGDVDGDGYDDVLNHVNTGTMDIDDQLWILSGRDGRTLRVRSVVGPTGIRFRTSAAAGDVDGDGVPDYACMKTDFTHVNPNVVEVVSGRDDQKLWSVSGPTADYYGWSLCGDLDLDGDRRPDLLVAAPRGFNFRGEMHAYSNSGRLLYTLRGDAQYALVPGQISAASLGDLDNDGCDDFAMTALHVDGRGRVLVISGRTGSVLREAAGELYGDAIGFSIAACGDLDLDGVTDFASGSIGMAWRQLVRVFSGRTCAPLYTLFAESGPQAAGFGTAVGGGVDVDRDGIPDIVVGAPGETVQLSPLVSGAAYVFSGRDGSVLHRLRAQGRSTWMGTFLAARKDPAGRPFETFVICENDYGPTQLSPFFLGRIRQFRGPPASTRVYGAGCGPGHPPLIGIHRLYGTDVTRVHLSGALPGEAALLLLGLSRTSWAGHPLPLRLDAHGLPGCALHTAIDVYLPVATGTTGVSSGYARVDLPRPLTGAGGLTLHAQWLMLGSASMSDALVCEIAP